MPFISETASAIKRRFGFHDRAASESVRSVPSTPDLILNSVSREIPGQSLVAASAIRSMGNLEEDDDGVSLAELANPSRSQIFEFNEDPSFWKDHNVQVIIRIRPLSSSEISIQGYSKCVRQESCQTITWTGHPDSRFNFDLVADENVSQEKMFKVAGVPMVENCVLGYNSCMFAYGQTGSGKTHTMLGDIEGGTRRHSVNCGMTPRVFEYLFARIQKEKEARKDEKLRFTCKCSFLEIYNEQILDLLDPSSNNLQLREDIKKGVHVENLKEIEVASARDVIQQLLQGAANRKVAATNMNRASSRSHSVFTCIIESKWESQGVTHHRFARLNLVDLAGSERQKSSGAEGERLKEATNINKSLSTLGLVIMNLVSISNGKSVHVPYRDSKLTFLLQDSLGGNSKTIIIANISPSTCGSSETLSTLKFAQRAKLIKNNAIVNEDASGDVIAMRLQIQQLKKEVSRLRVLVNDGAENQDNDTVSTGFPGSPISFKWEGLHGSFSPLTSDKRMSKAKDYEVALAGAFKREKEKDMAMQTLAAENQAAMQLAKQREDEIRGLKMILKLRDSAIKRLEAVASGKISAEAHLQKEKDECLKEIELLRAQINRNQEVTKFAMENLRLKEEIRRLKSYCEEGERDMMIEQIKVLQNKLLEALDWKLMHESDSSMLKEVLGDNNLLISNEKQQSTRLSSIRDENEFLRLQAIQNHAETEALRKSLSFCLEEKERLEKRVNDLVKEQQQERSLRDTNEDIPQAKLCNLSSDMSVINFNDDQMEVKKMVEAIACVSQREAEAHETAIKLSKENGDLRLKIKVLIEDNNKLIELYEQVAAENNSKTSEKSQEGPSNSCEYQNEENGVELKTEVENLEHQLMEMHEENEKLMSLFEKAMQERDEFKRLLSSTSPDRVVRGEFNNCPEKLVEVDGGTHLPAYIDANDSLEETTLDVNGNPNSEKCVQAGQAYEEILKSVGNESPELETSVQTGQANEVNLSDVTGFSGSNAEENLADACTFTDFEMKPFDLASRNFLEDIQSVRMKLETAQEKLSDSAETIMVFSSLEKAVMDTDRLSKEMEETEGSIREKRNQFGSVKLISEETKAKRALIEKKLSALKHSLSSFASSVAYFEQREARARTRVSASSSYLNQKKEEINILRSCKREIDAALGKILQSEAELNNNIVLLKIKLEEENKRHEEEKVLFAIDNIEKISTPQRNCLLTGKATELLKSEEEKTKLQAEMKLYREKLGSIRKELQDMNKKSANLESEIQTVQTEIEKSSKSLEQLEVTLRNVILEKETLYEVRENGKDETESMILEYHQLVFEADLREEELMSLEEEINSDESRIKELEKVRAETAKRVAELLEENKSNSNSLFLSEKIEGEIRSVLASVLEAKALLGEEELRRNDS